MKMRVDWFESELLLLLVACVIAPCALPGADPVAGPRDAIAPVSITASSTQTESKAARNLINGSGLAESRPGSGVWVHNSNAFRERGIERGTMWSSGDVNRKTETTPPLTLDLGKTQPVGSMRIWNYNEAG